MLPSLTKNYWISQVVIFIAYVSVDFFIHGIVIANYFWNALDRVSYPRTEVNYLALLIGMYLLSAAIAYVIQIIETVPGSITTVEMVILFTLLGGIFIVPYHIINYAFIPNYIFHFVVVDSIVSLTEFAIVGLIWQFFRNSRYYKNDQIMEN